MSSPGTANALFHGIIPGRGTPPALPFCPEGPLRGGSTNPPCYSPACEQALFWPILCAGYIAKIGGIAVRTLQKLPQPLSDSWVAQRPHCAV